MITKKHLKELGFIVRERRMFGSSTVNNITRREAILKLSSGNTLYVRGTQLFFIDAGSSITAPPTALWRQRHLPLNRTPIKQVAAIIKQCNSGLWLENVANAQMYTTYSSSVWFGDVVLSAPPTDRFTGFINNLVKWN